MTGDEGESAATVHHHADGGAEDVVAVVAVKGVEGTLTGWSRR
jgi:hypothetical protein